MTDAEDEAMDALVTMILNVITSPALAENAGRVNFVTSTEAEGFENEDETPP